MKPLISNQKFLEWQEKLKTSRPFLWLWSFLGIYSVLIIFFAAGLLVAKGYHKQVLAAFLAFVLARAIISPLIYLFYKKARPYQALNFTPIHSKLFSEPTTRSNSFPSDHAISFSAIAFVLAYFFPALGPGLFVLVFLNGLGRIILGYHYPSHVLAGWIFGIISAAGIIYFLYPIL